MLNTNTAGEWTVTTPRKVIGWSMEISVLATGAEWDAIEDRILLAICGGHGDNEEHVCVFDEWVASMEPIYEDEDD